MLFSFDASCGISIPQDASKVKGSFPAADMAGQVPFFGKIYIFTIRTYFFNIAKIEEMIQYGIIIKIMKRGALMSQHYIEFHDVVKSYGSGNAQINALSGVSFTIDRGEFCILLGSSGAGKTTLLNMLGGMDTVTSGRIEFDGKEISALSKRELIDYRRHDVGFVFQFYNLIPNLTALENVEIAAQLCKDPIPAAEALAMVGLTERANNFPAQLSGGEQQRVAIARALAKNPRLLLCDEPTGALDYVTGKAVLKLLYDLSRERVTTVIIITHNQAIAPMADRIVRIKSGKILSNEINTNVTPIDEIEW